jgi:TonB family protein
MKSLLPFIVILVLSSGVYSQSGRRAREPRAATPSPDQQALEPPPKPKQDEGISAPTESATVTAERNQDYRCMDDGSLARILESGSVEQTPKQVDSQAVITSKPAPSYTKEARRNGIQGFVVLKLLFTADGKISRVRVIKGLRDGLTVNAIRAACKIKFKPAMKGGQPVARWVTAEYLFRLVESSIFTP